MRRKTEEGTMKKWKQEERGKGEGRKEVCRREERDKGICINIGRLPNPIGVKVRNCKYSITEETNK